MRKIILILAAAVALNAKILVSVSIVPQAFFVEKIAGDLVEVNVMVEKGKNPEIYEPTIKQAQKLANSAAYFYIGMPFENAWLKRFQAVNKDMKIIPPLEKGQLAAYRKKHQIIEDSEFYSNHGHSHSHDTHTHEKSYHSHMPHIWLSFELSKLHIAQIAKVLSELDPQNAPIYAANLAAFSREIDAAYAKAAALFKDNKKTFIVFHPAWNYAARELKIEEFAIEKDGKETKIAHIREILDVIKRHNIKVIFAQPQFSRKNAEAIAKEAGVELSESDPFAYDWLNNLMAFLETIAKS